MEVKNERILAYCLLVILFSMGVVCYAAFPEKKPDQPVRIMFKSTAGDVLFDHKIHTSESGYGLECLDCHHDMEEEGEKAAACGECHFPEADEDEDAPKRSDAFHQQCIGCHEDDGTAPAKCEECHFMK